MDNQITDENYKYELGIVMDYVFCCVGLSAFLSSNLINLNKYVTIKPEDYNSYIEWLNSFIVKVSSIRDINNSPIYRSIMRELIVYTSSITKKISLFNKGYIAGFDQTLEILERLKIYNNQLMLGNPKLSEIFK